MQQQLSDTDAGPFMQQFMRAVTDWQNGTGDYEAILAMLQNQ